MKRTIELRGVAAEEHGIRYEIRDNSGLGLLRTETVEAWIKYYPCEGMAFSLSDAPPSVLAIPVTLYMLPVTWFYDVELVVPEMDKTLYDKLETIYAAYSKIYGPFKLEWRVPSWFKVDTLQET